MSSGSNSMVIGPCLCRMPMLLTLLLVLGSVCFSKSLSATSSASDPLPTFTIEELQTRQRRHELKDALSSTGILAISFDHVDVSQNYAHDRQTALKGLCDCHDHPDFLHMDQTRSIILPDDSTKRTSVGTATVGMDFPLPLPSDLEDLCGPETVRAMESLRDAIADVSVAFAFALEDLIEEYTHGNVLPLLQDKHGGKSYHTLSSIVKSANHLEHFHVYSKEMDRNNDNDSSGDSDDFSAAWDWHTDAGLFLVFVPALNCMREEQPQDTSFWYKDFNGRPIQARFDGSTTAIVMLGQGAEDWLSLAVPSNEVASRPLRLKATVHSVRWGTPLFTPQNGASLQQRSWYGMMFLVPETAMIYGTKTLKEVRSALSWQANANNNNLIMEETNSATIALGCGISEPNFGAELEPLEEDDHGAISKRRRLQHQDPSACNNVTNFFCWMQCLDIPNANQAQGYVNEGYSLYCLDPAILTSSGNRVSEAALPCEEGWVHNANCLGSWQPTAPGVPAATVNVTADATNFEDPFCYSGTSMYMDGFHFFQSTTCIIFLFQSWVLDTAGKYALAFLGTITTGICLEKLIQQRRKHMNEVAAGRQRLLFSATFYGIQLTIGYMLMLVIMIYSGAMFIATVMGLVLGHVFFNAKDAIWPLKTGATTMVIPQSDTSSDVGSNRGDSTDYPEQTVEMTAELTSQPAKFSPGSACCGRGQAARIAPNPGTQLIPEGSTPCCQYSSAE